MSEMSCSMGGIMGLNYPTVQGYLYSIQQQASLGYKCPMKMSFKEALKHANRVSGRNESLRSIAANTGVSYDILKNLNQDKSEKPNALAATKIADYYGASLSAFYEGDIPSDLTAGDTDLAKDAANISWIMRNLRKESRDRVKAFAEALRQTEEGPERNE